MRKKLLIRIQGESDDGCQPVRDQIRNPNRQNLQGMPSNNKNLGMAINAKKKLGCLSTMDG